MSFMKFGKGVKATSIFTVERFLSECLLLPEGYAYRGHGRHDWQLVPSAFRSSGIHVLKRTARDSRLRYFDSEKFSNDFDRLSDAGAAREGLHLKESGYQKLQKLVFFQHFGIPTPLLDWTYSPLVALFMAYVFRPEGSKRMRIFRLNLSSLPDGIMFQGYDKIGFERIRRQMGGVSFFGNLDESYNTISLQSTIFEEYYSENNNIDAIDMIDVEFKKSDDAILSSSFRTNGFTLDNMFPNSPYWLGRAISSGLPWLQRS